MPFLLQLPPQLRLLQLLHRPLLLLLPLPHALISACSAVAVTNDPAARVVHDGSTLTSADELACLHSSKTQQHKVHAVTVSCLPFV